MPHPTLVNEYEPLFCACSNILDNPDEEKYRQVKSTSPAFKQSISGIKGGENLLTMAGFHTKIIELVKYWAWEPDSIGVKASILWECREVSTVCIRIRESFERARLISRA